METGDGLDDDYILLSPTIQVNIGEDHFAPDETVNKNALQYTQYTPLSTAPVLESYFDHQTENIRDNVYKPRSLLNHRAAQRVKEDKRNIISMIKDHMFKYCAHRRDQSKRCEKSLHHSEEELKEDKDRQNYEINLLDRVMQMMMLNSMPKDPFLWRWRF